MSIEAEFRTEGFKQLNKRLSALSRDLRGKILRQAASASVNPFVKDARQAAPVGRRPHRTFKGRLVAPGFLSRSIRKRSRLSKDKNKVFVSVGPSSEAFYGTQFVEAGTSKLAAKPWLEPAFEKNKNVITNAFKTALKKRIAKSAKK